MNAINQNNFEEDTLENSTVSGIYAILNIANGKYYVGSSINIRVRWRDHKSYLVKSKHQNKYLQRAYTKYGQYCFIYTILEIVTNKFNLLDREQFWINNLNSANPKLGYNLTPTAGSLLGYIQSDAAKLKKSLALKGIKRSEETKNKMLISKKGHSVSIKTRIKIGSASKNRIVSASTRSKLSKAGKNRIVTEVTRLKLSASAKKRVVSKEHILRMVEARRIKKLLKEASNG